MRLPFGIFPAHWGLKGKTKAIIQAEYELEGEALERKLAEINIEDENELAIKLLSFDRKYKHLSKEEYDYKYVDLSFTGNEGILAKLALDQKYDKLTDVEYEKAVFSLDGKPWIGVAGSEYKPENGVSGFSFELDWNDAFVEMCRDAGYSGNNEEQIIEQWFDDVATEQLYTEMMSSEQEFMDGTPVVDPHFVPSTKTTHERIDKTKTKHS